MSNKCMIIFLFIPVILQTVSSNVLRTTMSSINQTSTSDLKKIDIQGSSEHVLYLPTNHITLKTEVPDDRDGTKYSYKWIIVKKPEATKKGFFDGMTSPKLKLQYLELGIYELRLEVRGKEAYGSKKVTIEVKPKKHKNHPPIAKIRPEFQTIELPNNLILDGSVSNDDDKIVTYHWDCIKGPIATKDLPDHTPTLEIKDIQPGNYTFKLTVTDNDGSTGTALAYATVIPGKDYPPKADPGENKIIQLPVNSVILNGTNSTDDKKIVSYLWTHKKFDGPAPDIVGQNTPILMLSNLHAGTYSFNLKVTDSAGQSSSKDVSVFVQERHNVGPVAVANPDKTPQVTVRLPATEAVLNGSLSSDDMAITRYKWSQIGNGQKLKLVDYDKVVAYVNDLKVGIFKFNLTVWDKEGLYSSDTVTLVVQENKNQPPKAKVKPEHKVMYLKDDLIKVDGSESWDDRNITRYLWEREDDSLAVGDILQNSNNKPVLLLTNLLPGIYKFTLRVFDDEGKSDSATTKIHVVSSDIEKYLVEIQFRCPSTNFTETKKKLMVSTIELVLQQQINDDTKKAHVHIARVERVPFGISVSAIFYCFIINKQVSSTKDVNTKPAENKRAAAVASQKTVSTTTLKPVPLIEYMDALTIVKALNVIRNDQRSWTFEIDRIETFICQNNCSNHGTCNPITKFCECETFWMSSLFRERFGDNRPNCDWSIIYLIVLFIIFTVIFSVMVLLLIWVKRRKCKSKKKMIGKDKKNKYIRLQSYVQVKKNGDYNEKVPKSLSNGIKSRMKTHDHESLLADSDSSLSSDYDESVLFQHTNHNNHMNTKLSPNNTSPIPQIHNNNNNNMKISSDTYRPEKQHDDSKAL